MAEAVGAAKAEVETTAVAVMGAMEAVMAVAAQRVAAAEGLAAGAEGKRPRSRWSC